MPRFDPDRLRVLAGDAAFARGVAYAEAGAVTLLGERADEVVAIVHGSDDYRVRLRGSGTRLAGDCTCPAFERDGWCKHLVAVARGNEKGRVERAIRYVRDNFFAARRFADLDDLNAQAIAWCNGTAAARRCPDQPELTVAQAFAAEAPRLLPLPDAPPTLLERVVLRIGKTPYARFDGNDYSVPHTEVGHQLTLLADPQEVRLTDGSRILARHPRS